MSLHYKTSKKYLPSALYFSSLKGVSIFSHFLQIAEIISVIMKKWISSRDQTADILKLINCGYILYTYLLYLILLKLLSGKCPEGILNTVSKLVYLRKI